MRSMFHAFGSTQNEMKPNYSKILDRELTKIQNAEMNGETAPTLLLHSCCAPCSSYVLEYLREYFKITVFYYNPNITESSEYRYRLSEEKKLIEAYNRQVEQQDFRGMNSTPAAMKIDILEAPYDPENYLEAVRGYEDCPERGERCAICFGMRLRKSAEAAARGGFDFYTTTLTISPLKDAALLNEIGAGAGEEFGVPFLPSDFKKKNGFKRSIELSAEFDLYRQNFCGCPFSKRDPLAHSPVHTI